jgi:hypothetical protein
MDKPKVSLTVEDIIEHSDGSATVTFVFDTETKEFLIQHAILDILKKAIQQTEDGTDKQAD